MIISAALMIPNKGANHEESKTQGTQKMQTLRRNVHAVSGLGCFLRRKLPHFLLARTTPEDIFGRT
jgi:hypothetical protein